MFDQTNISDFYVAEATTNEVSLDVRGGAGTMAITMANVMFSVPAGQRFTAGRIADGEGIYGETPYGQVGLASTMCVGAQFSVVSASYSGDRLTALDIRFSVDCGGWAPRLIGVLVLGGPATPLLSSARAPGCSRCRSGSPHPRSSR